MEANPLGSGAVEVKSRDGFPDVRAQFLPGVALRENVLRQALGAISAVGLLDDFKYQFAHI